MRRIRRVVSLFLLVVVLATLGWDTFFQPPAVPVAPAPVVRFQRPPRPVAPVPSSHPEPGSEPEEQAEAEADAEEVPMVEVDLFDLPEDTLEQLLVVGQKRLAELGEACGRFATEPLDVVSLMTIDEHGLLELEIQPTVLDAETITVDPGGHLPDPLVDCLGDELWSQDWSGVVGTLEPGTVTKIGLSMDLGRGEADPLR